MFERGNIYYITNNNSPIVGSEQASGRPAIVVSNDKNNNHSSVLEVVYLTTQPKTYLPTHVKITSSSKPSTALCEQVYSISVDRVGNWCGECTAEEMEQIDAALIISLGLTPPSKCESGNKRGRGRTVRLSLRPCGYHQVGNREEYLQETLRAVA